MQNIKNELGREGEDLAAAEYENRGYKIVARNERLHGVRQIGEIDLIAAKAGEKELVFVEVKTRRSFRFGTGAEAIDYFKRRKLVRAIAAYLKHNPRFDGWDWRCDVVQVNIDNLRKAVIILENVIEDIN